MSKSQTKKITKIIACHSEGHKKYSAQKELEQLNIPVHFGYKEATITDIHNALVPYYNKINEIIKYINANQERGKVGHTPHPRKILK